MQLSGVQIIAQSLKAEGTERVFGHLDDTVLETYDAISQLGKFKHILVHCEQTTVHAVDAYACISGKADVALVTSGSGTTNTLTGIAITYSDSTPLAVITGQVDTPSIGTDAFQEMDTVGISRPRVKHSFLVADISELAVTLKKAPQIAISGRPGSVVIGAPKDVVQTMAKFSYSQEDTFVRSYQPAVNGHMGQVKKTVQMFASAKRLVAYSDGGTVLGNAAQELTDSARMTGVPCVGMLMGLGAYPSSDRQFSGMLGMHGTYEANLAMQNADVVLTVGARFGDRVVSVPSKFLEKTKKTTHVDVDPSNIVKRVKVDIPIVGNVKNVLAEMNGLLSKREFAANRDGLDKRWRNIEKWCARDCLWSDSDNEIIKPQYVAQELAEITGNSAIITSDVGQHQMLAARYYPFQRPRQWLNSGDLGTMGVGLPYAMGAKLVTPEQDVFCITGEGSIQMNIRELSTCFQYHIPINVVTLNNGYPGMVCQWQELYYGNRESEIYFDFLPDFMKLAETYGHIGIRVDKKSDMEGALLEALNQKGRLVFLDFLTDKKQNVLPMVGNGKGLDEMILPPYMRETEADSDVNDVSDRDYDTRSML